MTFVQILLATYSVRNIDGSTYEYVAGSFFPGRSCERRNECARDPKTTNGLIAPFMWLTSMKMQ
jgi:hypothetical protein